MIACNCSESLGNTGVPGCQPLFGVTVKEIFVPIFDSTGAKNRIDLSVPLTQIIWDALLEQTDPTKRFYPTPIIQEFLSERADSVFDEASSGDKDFIKQGTRGESYEIRKQAGYYKGQLDKLRCNEVGKFSIDREGNIRGMVIVDSNGVNDGFLYPIKLDKNSINVTMTFASDVNTNVAKLLVTYDYDQLEDDSLLRMVEKKDIGANLLASNGLIEIISILSAITTAGFTIELTSQFGGLLSLAPDSGLLAADFFDVAGGTPSNVFNVTDSAAEPLASVTETAVGSGIYDVVYTTPVTALDVIRVTIVSAGKSYTAVINKNVLTP